MKTKTRTGTKRRALRSVRIAQPGFLTREEVVAAFRSDPTGNALVALLRKHGFAPRNPRIIAKEKFTPLPALF